MNDPLNSPDRARQFLPFAALTGFEGFIDAEEQADAATQADPRGFRATGFADPDADPRTEGEDAAPGPFAPPSDSAAFREIRQSRPWDLRSARILFHEQQKREECAHGRSNCEEELGRSHHL